MQFVRGQKGNLAHKQLHFLKIPMCEHGLGLCRCFGDISPKLPAVVRTGEGIFVKSGNIWLGPETSFKIHC